VVEYKDNTAAGLVAVVADMGWAGCIPAASGAVALAPVGLAVGIYSVVCSTEEVAGDDNSCAPSTTTATTPDANQKVHLNLT
jgi:hypothetical protein